MTKKRHILKIMKLESANVDFCLKKDKKKHDWTK